ncbi:10959_t:CDS:2, partial [Racocetra fulgida]
MPTSSTCAGDLPSDAFIYKGKNYNTCNSCRISRVEKRNTKKNKLLGDFNPEQTFVKIISVQEISNYITNAINDLDDHAELSLTFCVRLDEATINDIDADVRVMAKLIIDEIEEGDNYKWTATTTPNLSARYPSVGNAYFACSQSLELEREFKDSSRERIFCYNCDGQISIKIDIPATEAKIVLKHKVLYERPIDTTMSSEIKQEIKVAKEFTFVNSSFIPDLQRTDSEYYIICPPALHGTVIEMVKNYFNIHPKIPTNSGQFLSPKEIRTKAVFEIYEFCIANNLVLLWTYL